MTLTKVSGSILKDPLNLGEVSIGGTLTYEDVTNVDSVGLITARSGIDCNGDLDVAGVTTVTGGLLHIKDNTSPAIRLQDNNNVNSDFKIYSPDGDNHLRIYHQNTSSDLVSLTSAGNVGIGYTNPDVPLKVNGIIQSSSAFRVAGHPVVSYSAFAGTYATRLGSTGTTTLKHTQIYGGGSHIATFDGDNTYLGIGVTNPNATIHIASGSNASLGNATNPAFQIGGTTNYRFGAYTTGEQAIIANRNGDDGISFHTKTGNSGSFGQALRIHSTGQVGIATDLEFGATNNVKLLVNGEIALRYSSKGDGSVVQMGSYGKAVTMTTSALDVLQFHSFGNGAVEITVFRRDTTNPQGAQVTKLYIAFGGSGHNITSASLVQEDKVTRGSIHNFTYTISENNTYATLTATGNDNGGEAQTLDFYCIHSGGNSRTISVP